MWLLGGKRSPDHSTIAHFRAQRLPLVMESLLGRLMEKLLEVGKIDYETEFIDGTKLEANANPYSSNADKTAPAHSS